MLLRTWTPERGVLPQVQTSSSGPEAGQEAAAASAQCQPMALALMAQAQWVGAAWDSRAAARPQPRCMQATLRAAAGVGGVAARCPRGPSQGAPAFGVLRLDSAERGLSLLGASLQGVVPALGHL